MIIFINKIPILFKIINKQIGLIKKNFFNINMSFKLMNVNLKTDNNFLRNFS